MHRLFVAVAILVVTLATPSTSEDTPEGDLLINGELWDTDVVLEPRDVVSNPRDQQVSEVADSEHKAMVRSYKVYKKQRLHNDYHRKMQARKRWRYPGRKGKGSRAGSLSVKSTPSKEVNNRRKNQGWERWRFPGRKGKGSRAGSLPVKSTPSKEVNNRRKNQGWERWRFPGRKGKGSRAGSLPVKSTPSKEVNNRRKDQGRERWRNPGHKGKGNNAGSLPVKSTPSKEVNNRRKDQGRERWRNPGHKGKGNNAGSSPGKSAPSKEVDNRRKDQGRERWRNPGHKEKGNNAGSSPGKSVPSSVGGDQEDRPPAAGSNSTNNSTEGQATVSADPGATGANPESSSPPAAKSNGTVKSEDGKVQSPFGNYDSRNQCFERFPRNFRLRVSSRCQSQSIRRCIDYALRKNPAVAEALKGGYSRCNKAYVNYAGLAETCPTKTNIATAVYLGREMCYVVTPYQQCVTFSSCGTPRGGCAESQGAPSFSSCLYDGFRETPVWVYCRHCGLKLVRLSLPQCCSCRKWSLCTGRGGSPGL